jgi:hypothetical protein
MSKGPSGIKAIGAPSFPVSFGANVSAAWTSPLPINGVMMSRIPSVKNRMLRANIKCDIAYSPLIARTRILMNSFSENTIFF